MKALILGIAGQDGSYLAELLLKEGIDVYGVIRRSSWPNTGRIDHIFKPESKGKIFYGDISNSIEHIISDIKPDYVFNLAAQSHVGISFSNPDYTINVNGLGPLRILESIKNIGLKDTRYYQASSSEIFGTTPPPQNEHSRHNPVSPYGCAKLLGYNITRMYRDGYGMFACNGILFNHESERRGHNFVTRKITRGAARIKLGLQDKLYLGNLEAMRDWGHSEDYVEAIWKIINHDKPDDFVVATGELYTVAVFLEYVFHLLELDVKEHVVIDNTYFRPIEVPALLGDATKIRETLGWQPKVKFKELVKRMVDYDLKTEAKANV